MEVLRRRLLLTMCQALQSESRSQSTRRSDAFLSSLLDVTDRWMSRWLRRAPTWRTTWRTAKRGDDDRRSCARLFRARCVPASGCDRHAAWNVSNVRQMLEVHCRAFDRRRVRNLRPGVFVRRLVLSPNRMPVMHPYAREDINCAC